MIRLEPGLEKHCSECSEIAKKAKAKLRPDSDVIDSSAKIRKLLEIVLDIERRSGQKEKTIVFSQFTSFLNLIEPFLRAEGIEFVRCECRRGYDIFGSADDSRRRDEKRQTIGSAARHQNRPERPTHLDQFQSG